MSDPLAKLLSVGQDQYGLLSEVQFAASATRAQQRRLLRQGIIERYAEGVYVLAGTPPRWRQRALAACLAYGPPVAVSGTAAARLWGLDGVACRAIEVTVPPGRSGRRPLAVTRRRSLTPEDIARLHGIPVTAVPRTLADLAGELPEDVLATAIDDVVVRRLISVEDLHRYLDGGMTGRRHGHQVLRSLVARRLGEGDAEASVWELQVYRWVVGAGLPPPVRQFAVVIAGVPRRLDLAYPDLKIAIEFQGFRHHGRGRGRFDRDQQRTSELTLAGWIVVLVTSAMSPEYVVDMVRRARRLRGAA